MINTTNASVGIILTAVLLAYHVVGFAFWMLLFWVLHLPLEGLRLIHLEGVDMG